VNNQKTNGKQVQPARGGKRKRVPDVRKEKQKMKYFASALLILSLAFAVSAQDPATLKVSNSDSYRLMSDPLAIRGLDWSRTPLTLHVKGVTTNQGFLPLGKVEGSGRLCADGKDWLNLKDGIVHAAAENATPTSPYLMGCKTKSGSFVPATREIQ
jgi:hypothetical protein